jgi:hypothetical protein
LNVVVVVSADDDDVKPEPSQREADGKSARLRETAHRLLSWKWKKKTKRAAGVNVAAATPGALPPKRSRAVD